MTHFQLWLRLEHRRPSHLIASSVVARVRICPWRQQLGQGHASRRLHRGAWNFRFVASRVSFVRILRVVHVSRPAVQGLRSELLSTATLHAVGEPDRVFAL